MAASARGTLDGKIIEVSSFDNDPPDAKKGDRADVGKAANMAFMITAVVGGLPLALGVISGGVGNTIGGALMAVCGGFVLLLAAMVVSGVLAFIYSWRNKPEVSDRDLRFESFQKRFQARPDV